MRRIFKWIITLMEICMGLGVIVSRIEKKCGKVGWVEEHKPYGFYEKNVKRPLDFGLSLFALIALSPVIIVTNLLVKIKLGSPVIFKQGRPGLGGRTFNILKYRTMTNQRDDNGELLPDKDRLTTFGSWLRASSIDELLELINIIKGDMSIVGPRPLLIEYLPYYRESEKHRHDVRPGLSGLAQINGRNNLNWDDRLACDVKYVNHVTFFQDAGIVLKTLNKVLKFEGVATNSESVETWLNRERALNEG